MPETQSDALVELGESDLSDVVGGIALLLPAVQAAREAARRSSLSEADTGAIAAG